MAKRFEELDALRGLAAAWVAIAHISAAGQWITDPLHPAIRFSPLRFLSQPHIPVVFFFVLSGFVLHRSIASRHDSYVAYAARRFIRIYVPYAASLIFSAGGMLFFLNPAVTAGLKDPDWAELNTATLLGHLAMTGLREHAQINGVIWSLIHEMRISLVLPLLALAFQRSIAAGLAVGFVVSLTGLATLSVFGQTQFYFPNSIFLGLPMSMFYLAPFTVGMALSEIVERYSPKSLAAGSLIAFCLSIIIIRALGLFYTGPSDYIVSIAAASVMAFAISSSTISNILRISALQYLGRISYSLYLFHLPTMLILIHCLHGRIGVGWVMIAAVPLVAIVAATAHHLVEAPSIRLSRRVARRCNAASSPSVPKAEVTSER